MNILLTGGTGYIGSHAAVVFARLGHQVVLFDNLVNSDAGVAERVSFLAGKTVPLVIGDVRDRDILADALKRHAIDAVVHFAGLKAVGESVQKPIDYYANNVQGTISLVQAMESAGIHRLVFSSSATVYGTPRYLPYDEKHPVGAINPYGRTKQHVEDMLADLAASSPAWCIACLRYFNPVGAHESGLIGENPQGIPNNLMPFIAQVASGERPFLSVFGDDYDTPDGTGVRDYVHVMDLVEGHAAALDYLQSHAGWHAFNLGTGQGISVLDVIRSFEKASGCPVPYQVAARRAGDLPAYYADAGKANHLLGWQGHRDLDEMCRSTWNFQQRLKQSFAG
ncbi:UDP-glucose 4-epimerase GalE [Laribacter hongkongensis]|uniref:UDP-glucose 4-epimerase GalE n=1 Tax=Laribacter hongkongensis TaxID=168471 RepID=UPI001EFCC580|nr:UDP-glucose 4-epimerase GalE [Laribacter hongkongensis]MCG9059517.1 UDP-glucose 4-epimerase GalE [Laribacter hongkongensis]MCG9086972.1 UDP-glucose 4-epimerase GalE [Laribacter hongkongensis]